MKSVMAVVVGVAGAWAAGDIIPLDGTQTSRGRVEVFLGAVSQGSKAFNLAAPSATASWSPGARDIGMDIPGGPGAHVQSTYASTISAGGVSLQLDSRGWTTGNMPNPSGNTGQFEWEHMFQLRLRLTAPGDYLVSGEIMRLNVGGWRGAPTSLTFEPDGQAAIVSLATPAALPSPMPLVVTFGPSVVHLDAGVYSITAFDPMSWGAKNHELIGSMDLSITAVPAPGAMALLAAVAVGARRRENR